MPDHSEDVGRQLRQRREDLGLTQQDVAAHLEITTRTIQLTEHGRTTIRIGKRRAWERVLDLQRGSISRAYRDGLALEPAEPATDGGEPWRDEEWCVYSHDNPEYDEKDRRLAVNLLRMALWGLPERRDWTPPSTAMSEKDGDA